MATLDRRFQFVDCKLQGDLLALVRQRGVRHSVDADGGLWYASADSAVIENELTSTIRESVFPQWGIFTLEGDDIARPRTTNQFRSYMIEHGIPFAEEVMDGFTWFLVPEEQDSFGWDIPYREEG